MLLLLLVADCCRLLYKLLLTVCWLAHVVLPRLLLLLRVHLVQVRVTLRYHHQLLLTLHLDPHDVVIRCCARSLELLLGSCNSLSNSLFLSVSGFFAARN